MSQWYARIETDLIRHAIIRHVTGRPLTEFDSIEHNLFRWGDRESNMTALWDCTRKMFDLGESWVFPPEDWFLDAVAMFESGTQEIRSSAPFCDCLNEVPFVMFPGAMTVKKQIVVNHGVRPTVAYHIACALQLVVKDQDVATFDWKDFRRAMRWDEGYATGARHRMCADQRIKCVTVNRHEGAPAWGSGCVTTVTFLKDDQYTAPKGLKSARCTTCEGWGTTGLACVRCEACKGAGARQDSPPPLPPGSTPGVS